MIGQSIAHYRIVRKLGEGGMGVVYQAFDERLERMVALKFLSSLVPLDDAERARFLQEARAGSALTHAHVCVVHDIQDHDGRPFIVMEYVEGTTLRERIASGPLPVKTVVDIAVQVCEALQEAHARGIIHRDIKSENIMLGPKGQVKVMDFGLARLKGVAAGMVTSSTTGTLAYMAPEQIRDGVSDARSDIFSVGVVLYEMLAGELPFQGEREATLMYAILNTEPAPIHTRREGLGSEFDHVLQRALEKDPEERYQSVADLAIDLRRIRRDSDRITRPVSLAGGGKAGPNEIGPGANRGESPGAGGLGPAPGATPPTPSGPVATSPAAPAAVAAASEAAARRTGIPRSWLFAVLAVLAVLVAAAAVLWIGRARRAPTVGSAMTFRVLTLPFDEIGYPGLSQDGKWAAFTAADARGTWDVYFMNVNGGDVRRISSDSSQGARYLDIAPDGSRIAYEAARSDGRFELRVIPTLGGASQSLATGASGMHWSPDGSRIGYILSSPTAQSGRRELWSIRPDGTDARREFVDTAGVATGGRIGFGWSPGGRSVAWIRNMTASSQEIVIRELSTGRERQLTRDGRSIDEVCWTPQGRIVFSSNRSGNTNLWMMDAAGGPIVQVTKGAGPDIGMRVSEDGRTMLYLQQQPTAHLWVSPTDRAAPVLVTNEDLPIGAPTVSPDGATIAVTMRDPDPLNRASHLMLMNRDGTNRRQVTQGDEEVLGSSWSPDGKLAVVRVALNQPNDSAMTYVMDPKQPGSIRPVGRGRGWSWLNENVIYLDQPTRTLRASLDGSSPVPMLQESTQARPDGAGLYEAFFDMRAGRQGVWIRTLSSRNGTTPGLKLIKSGNAPLFSAPGGNMRLVYTGPGRAAKMAPPTWDPVPIPGTFTGFGLQSGGSMRWDGREFVYTEVRQASKLILVENLR